MAINSLNSGSHGLSGLASGMDTQQMVEAMLANTQNKLDVSKQKRVQLTEKQNLYRDIIAKMNTFSDTFFSFTSPATNLFSNAFFNTMTATSASKAYKVTAGTGATTGKTTINYIKQLAESAQAKSTDSVTGKLDGKLDAAKLEELRASLTKEISFQVEGGTEVKIRLDELIGTGDKPNGLFKIEEILQDKLGAEFKVSTESGLLQVQSANGSKLSISTAKEDVAALGIFGLSGNASSDTGKLSLDVDSEAVLPKLKLKMNGVEKEIVFNPLTENTGVPDSEKLTLDETVKRLNDAAQNAFGKKVQVVKNTTGNGVEFQTVNSNGSLDRTSQLYVSASGTEGSMLMDALGIRNNKSNKINTGMTLAEANFGTAVNGSVQKFTINGVDFTFNSSDSISSMMETINRSKAGVNISYLSSEDKFQIESKVSGELATATPFTMSQTEGNVLSAMFGVEGSNAVSSYSLTGKGLIKGTEKTFTEADFPVGKSTVKLNIDGVDYDFEIEFKDKDTKDVATYVTKLNEAINANEKTKGKVAFSQETSETKATTVTMKVGDKTAVVVGDGLAFVGIDSGKSTYAGVPKGDITMGMLGRDGMTVTLNGRDITAGVNETVAEFTERLNLAVQIEQGANPNSGVAYEESTGRYRLFGIDIPMTIQVTGDDKSLFGTSDPIIVGKTAGSGYAMVQDGQNAILSINGVEMERSSNNFTLDGLTYELRDTTPVDASGNPIINNNDTIEVTRNTDQIYDGIVKFVEEYNKMVDSINELLDAKPNFRDYPPLTDKQKSEMSDKEIEQWEEKSKEGLLRNDSTLQTVMSNLRNTLYTRPEGGIALYDLGIETTSSLTGVKDHLTIKDSTKLKQMINESPDVVQNLFANPEESLSKALKDAIQTSAGTSPGSPGMLVRMAGAKGRVDTSSSIYRQLKDVNERIGNLERTYELEYQRYWKQFNNMEQMIQQMNSQSSWLSQQFAG